MSIINTKQNILDSVILSSVNIINEIPNLTKYLINNRNSIVIPNDKLFILFKNIPYMSHSPITDFYNIIKQDDFEPFCFISTIDKSAVPDILLYKHFNIDFNFFNTIIPNKIQNIQYLPEFKNKIIINLLEYLDVKQTKILDVSGFYKILVRTLCSRSYDTFENVWINRDFIDFLTKTYSFIIGSNIARIFNFSIQEQSTLNIILAYYFINKCIISDNKTKINFISNLSYLGNKIKILDTLNTIDDILNKKPFTEISSLIFILKELSPNSLNKLNLSSFMTLVRTFNYNNLISIISIDYPGYWLYNLFCSVSGDRNNIFFIAKKINLLKEIIIFINNLLYNSMFIKSLQPK